MPIIKTSELIGPALEWVVASIEYPNDTVVKTPAFYLPGDYEFSTDWSQGGPIIEKERINLFHYQSDEDGQPCDPGWEAYIYLGNEHSLGSTALIAAMRCYVASKLGEVVDVPAELCNPI